MKTLICMLAFIAGAMSVYLGVNDLKRKRYFPSVLDFILFSADMIIIILTIHTLP